MERRHFAEPYEVRREKAVAMYKAGETVHSIKRTVGVYSVEFLDYLKTIGVPMRQKSTQRPEQSVEHQLNGKPSLPSRAELAAKSEPTSLTVSSTVRRSKNVRYLEPPEGYVLARPYKFGPVTLTPGELAMLPSGALYCNHGQQSLHLDRAVRLKERRRASSQPADAPELKEAKLAIIERVCAGSGLKQSEFLQKWMLLSGSSLTSAFKQNRFIPERHVARALYLERTKLHGRTNFWDDKMPEPERRKRQVSEALAIFGGKSQDFARALGTSPGAMSHHVTGSHYSPRIVMLVDKWMEEHGGWPQYTGKDAKTALWERPEDDQDTEVSTEDSGSVPRATSGEPTEEPAEEKAGDAMPEEEADLGRALIDSSMRKQEELMKDVATGFVIDEDLQRSIDDAKAGRNLRPAKEFLDELRKEAYDKGDAAVAGRLGPREAYDLTRALIDRGLYAKSAAQQAVDAIKLINAELAGEDR